MRLFVGIDIHDDIRQKLREYVQALQRKLPPESVKWTRPEGWHITLKFVGESTAVEAIQGALASVPVAPIQISVRNTGFFTPEAPRIFWAGIDAPQELSVLAGQVDIATAGVGVPQEDRHFSPHLTLARFSSGRPHVSRPDLDAPRLIPLVRLVNSTPGLSEIEFGTMTATEFHLYRSEPGPGGSKYTRLETFGTSR